MTFASPVVVVFYEIVTDSCRFFVVVVVLVYCMFAFNFFFD